MPTSLFPARFYPYKVSLILLLLVWLIPAQWAKAAETSVRDSSRHVFRIRLGTSMTFIGGDRNTRFREYTWAVQGSVNPIGGLHLGFKMLNIWRSSLLSWRERFLVMGGYAQYHFGKPDVITVFPEIGYFKGDYCTCGYQDNYRKPSLTYLLVGGGFQVNLRYGFGVQAAFMAYQILQKIIPRSTYTQYVLGLTYDIKFRRRTVVRELDWEGK